MEVAYGWNLHRHVDHYGQSDRQHTRLLCLGDHYRDHDRNERPLVKEESYMS